MYIVYYVYLSNIEQITYSSESKLLFILIKH